MGSDSMRFHGFIQIFPLAPEPPNGSHDVGLTVALAEQNANAYNAFVGPWAGGASGVRPGRGGSRRPSRGWIQRPCDRFGVSEGRWTPGMAREVPGPPRVRAIRFFGGRAGAGDSGIRLRPYETGVSPAMRGGGHGRIRGGPTPVPPESRMVPVGGCSGRLLRWAAYLSL